MGEAKRRGTYNERKEKAIMKKLIADQRNEIAASVAKEIDKHILDMMIDQNAILINGRK